MFNMIQPLHEMIDATDPFSGFVFIETTRPPLHGGFDALGFLTGHDGPVHFSWRAQVASAVGLGHAATPRPDGERKLERRGAAKGQTNPEGRASQRPVALVLLVTKGITSTRSKKLVASCY